jgi:hypothetical protein
MNMAEFDRWRNAWGAAMAEAGYPAVSLESVLDPDGVSYAWAVAWADDSEHDAWEAAHKAFVTVDALRPEWVRPSFALAERLAGRR